MNAECIHFQFSCSNSMPFNTKLNTCWHYVNPKNKSSLNLVILNLHCFSIGIITLDLFLLTL